MRIVAKDLNHHLKKGLQPAYGVFGEEPLQYQESLDQIRLKAFDAGYSARSRWQLETGFDSQAMLAHLKTPDLFCEKRLLEFHLPDTASNAQQRDFCTQLLEQLPGLKNTVVLIASPKFDAALQKTPWFKSLEASGLVITCRSLNRSQMQTWLIDRLKQTGFEASPLVIDRLLDRTEGHLLAATQALAKLKLYGTDKTLTLEDCDAAIEPSAHFEIFECMDAALAGLPLRTLKILEHLKQEGLTDPNQLLWTIHQAITPCIALLQQSPQGPSPLALREAGIWQSKIALVQTFLKRQTPQKLQALFLELKNVDDILKGRRTGNAWGAVRALCLNIAGAGVPCV